MNNSIRAGIWVVALAALAQPAGAGSVPNPKVTGPIPSSVEPGHPSHDYPFFSTTLDLPRYGYVEEEFIFEGTANRYNTPALATGSIVDGGHLYRTRMIVRRPALPGMFNGTVLMEWQNVTDNNDLDAFWAQSHDHFIRRGYAWIGVSVQQAGIHSPVTGLKAWSPSRYGTLDVTRGGTILDDALSYDIFAQAAQAVRKPTGVDPMGGLPVERVFAVGASVSANRLVTYHNSIHPLAGVFDGFILVVGGGLLRTDLEVKVFKIASETDVATGNRVANRQPDTDLLRSWELAGSSHVDFHLSQELAPLRARDNLPQLPAECDLPRLSRIPLYYVGNAAYDHMVRWVKEKIQPPTAPGIQLVRPGPPVVVARDTFGNALGGIPLSQHAVPTATNTGVNSGPGFCRLYGTFQPFDDATLDALYPSHKIYLIQVMQATDENLWHGFIVPEDALETIRDAVYSDKGRH